MKLAKSSVQTRRHVCASPSCTTPSDAGAVTASSPSNSHTKPETPFAGRFKEETRHRQKTGVFSASLLPTFFPPKPPLPRLSQTIPVTLPQSRAHFLCFIKHRREEIWSKTGSALWGQSLLKTPSPFTWEATESEDNRHMRVTFLWEKGPVPTLRGWRAHHKHPELGRGWRGGAAAGALQGQPGHPAPLLSPGRPGRTSGEGVPPSVPPSRGRIPVRGAAESTGRGTGSEREGHRDTRGAGCRWPLSGEVPTRVCAPTGG